MSSHHKCININVCKCKCVKVKNSSSIKVEDQIPHENAEENLDGCLNPIYDVVVLPKEKQPDSCKTVIKYAKKTNNKFLLRKRQLFNQLNDEKLEYTKNGICDSYIKYGKPSLGDVIDNIKLKADAKSKRLDRLLMRLRTEGEMYDESNSYYNKYINIGGNLEEIINEGIKEWFYINKTNYRSFFKLYKNEDIAQAKAFNAYIKKNGNDKYTERIRKSEMVLRLF